MCDLSESQKSNMAAAKPEIPHITACRGDRIEIPMVIPMFVRSSYTRLDYCKDYLACKFVKSQRWRPVTGSVYDKTLNSAGSWDRIEILTAISMFSNSNIAK